VELTGYQWLTLGMGAVGFLATWMLGAFKLGRVVEQMRAAIKQDIADERESILSKIENLEAKFIDEQKSQDHNFGEVGAAMRQYIADVEKKVREVEIWGRDHYVQKTDFQAMLEQLRDDLKAAVGEIKEDIRRLVAPIQRSSRED
jgi:predicted transcriptional regulator